MTGVTPGLRDLLGKLTAHRLFSWTSGYAPQDAPMTEQGVPDLDKADVVSSAYRDGSGHALLLDIDYPVHQVESSTPGKSHLYFEVPTPLSTEALAEINNVLAKHNVIEPGYAGASNRRGYNSLRVPWKPKGRPILRCVGCGKRPDEIEEYLKGNQPVEVQVEPDYYVWREEGTLDRETGRFTCTTCYVRMGMPSGPNGWTAGMREGFELTGPAETNLAPDWEPAVAWPKDPNAPAHHSSEIPTEDLRF
jgi:hypothetical protein